MQTHSMRCPSWNEHEFSGPVIQATGYVPFRGWFRRERQTCLKCGAELVAEQWIPIERRTLAVGSSDGQA